MDNGVSFSEAKSQAQSELVKMFNIDNVTLGNSEILDISKSGDDNAVLLAISVILQSNRTEAELTELLSTINTDIRSDGILNSSSTQQKLVDGLEHIKPQITSIRTNIKNRYDDLGLVSNIPSFESYVLKLDTEVPTVSSTSHSDNTSKIAVNLPITFTFSDYMDNNSISSSKIYLTDNLSNLIPGSITYLDNKSLTLTPDNNLSENATYTGFVKAGIKDLAGNPLESDYSWTFKTGDFTAPIISEVTPIKSNGNDSTPDVVISASEPGTLTFGGDCSSGSNNVVNGNNTLTLNSLNDGTYPNCTISIKDIESNVGNTITLTSFTVDTVAPTVSSTNPTDGTDKIVSIISATFSEVMDNSTITTSTFTLKDASNNSISGTVTSSDSGSATTSTFTPSSDFSRSIEYTATLSSGIKDLSGNSLLSQTTISFTQPWTQQLGTSSRDWVNGVAIDSSGNIYVAGQTQGGLDGNPSAGSNDLILVKYNSSGSKQWTKQLGTSSSEIAYGVATDLSGNVYVTGSTEGGLDGNSSSGNVDLFVVKYNSSGTKLFSKQLGNASSDIGTGISVDSSGNIYLSGRSTGDIEGNGSASNEQAFLMKLNSSGIKQWTEQQIVVDGSGCSFSDNRYSLIITNDGIFITGITGASSPSGCSDSFLSKYNSSGTLIW